jgi:hypothetical protein
VHVAQGNNGTFSHDNPTDRYGWDFSLRRGERVLSGVHGVVAVAAGGCPLPYSFDCHDGWGNTVTVHLADATCARYRAFGHRLGVARAGRRTWQLDRHRRIDRALNRAASALPA